MTTMQFAGTFKNLHTYAMDAAPAKDGLSSEALATLKFDVQKQFPELAVTGDVFASPARLEISHPQTGQISNKVREADAFARKELQRQGVTFEYEA